NRNVQEVRIQIAPKRGKKKKKKKFQPRRKERSFRTPQVSLRRSRWRLTALLRRIAGNSVTPPTMKEKGNQAVPCIGNSDGRCFSKEDLPKIKAGTEDLEVDIVDCSSSCNVRQVVEVDNDDTDESLSSFSGTSDTENELKSGDDEVESIMFPDNNACSLFAGSRSRRKRLTEHWRKFIHPLMRRCKWIELQLKELRSQALKNDSDLAEIEIRKALYKRFNEEGFEGRQINKLYCIFFKPETKKAAKDGSPIQSDLPLLDRTVKIDQGSAFWYGWEFPHSKDLHSMDEETLMELEAAHSQVRKWRSRIDVLMRVNPGKFSYATTSSSLPPPPELLASSRNPPGSLVENRDGEAQQSLRPSTQMQTLDDLMPANAASPSSGEEVPLPDMSEGMDWPFDEESPFDIEQYFVTVDQPATDETMHDLDDFGGLLNKEKPESPNDKPEPTTTQSNQQAWVPLLKMNCPGKSVPKSRCRVTSIKRKRGKRKSGVSGWKSKIISKK
ncbi:hypothetical protein LINPERPRIM_LOCUS39692, partial [Linum perenne]